MLRQALARKIKTFDTISEIERQKLLSLCSEFKLLRRKREITSRGHQPTHVRVVLDGWAARYSLSANGGRQITAILLPGDFCDIPVKLFPAADHGIVALTDCRLGLIEGQAIDDMIRSSPSLMLAFWRLTLIDEAIGHQWLTRMGRLNAYQRVAHLFCELHTRLRQAGLADDSRMEMALTQSDIGDATGLTAVHVNRMLRELCTQLGIKMVGAQLNIPNLALLHRAGAFDSSYLRGVT